LLWLRTMIDRRRTPRRPVLDAAIGSLRVVNDVEIHRLGPTEVTILTDACVPRGERLQLHVQGAGGTGVDLLVEALEHRASVASGRVRQRVRLQILRALPSGAGS
jgi:hypothetical protein